MTAQAGDTSNASAATQKLDLRRRLRLQRRQIPKSTRHLAEQRATQRLLSLRELRHARHVAVYLATASELCTDALIAALFKRGCRVYAPVAQGDGVMRFLPLSTQPSRRRDALGLPRPQVSRGDRSPRRFDVVILPMVGFDAQAHRLGAGGGYYDRAFAFRRHRQHRPKLIGLAFELQRVEQLPVEDWDLRLDAIVSERRVYRRSLI